MPQHPQYSNSPARDLDRLQDLLAELERYGFVHEDIHQNIEQLMAELHPEALKRWIKDETGDDPEASDEHSDWTPSVSTLFAYVDPAGEPQFIQDLRNVIAHCMFSDSWSIEGVADTIREGRNLDYYRMHVHLVEDTDTLRAYEYAKRTLWFPPECKPGRAGAYEISSHSYNPKHGGFAYWDGKNWYASEILLSSCLAQPRTTENLSRWDYCWRGFTEPQA